MGATGDPRHCTWDEGQEMVPACVHHLHCSRFVAAVGQRLPERRPPVKGKDRD